MHGFTQRARRAALGHGIGRDRAGEVRHQRRRDDEHRVADQRHVVAIAQLGTETGTADVRRIADAEDVHILAEGDVVFTEAALGAQVGEIGRLLVDDAGRRRGGRERLPADGGADRWTRHVREAGRQHELGLHVVAAAVVRAERAVGPLGAPAQRQAVVARVVVRLDVLAAPGTQVRRGSGHLGCERVAGGDERITTPQQRVVDAQIGSRLRIPIGLVVEALPVEEVLCRDGQGVGHLRLDVESDARAEQLLGLGAWRRESLPQVDRVLRIRDAVEGTAEQQALAPVDRGLAQLDVDRRLADVELGEAEHVEELAGRALGVTLGVPVEAQHRQAVLEVVRSVPGLVVQAAVAGVPPAGGADPEAERSLPDQVELAQQVEAREHAAAVEVAVAVVEVRVGEHRLVLRFSPDRDVGAHGGVEPDREILVAGVDFERACHRRQRERGGHCDAERTGPSHTGVPGQTARFNAHPGIPRGC